MRISSYSAVLALAVFAGQIPQSQPASASRQAKGATSRSATKEGVTKEGVSKNDPLNELLKQLASKLRKKNAPKSVDGFYAEAKINNPNPDNNVDVIAFIIYQGQNGRKQLRVKITEGKTTTVRVKNGVFYWAEQRGKSYRLSGKTYVTDRANVRRDYTLAKLTTRFLYPDRELRKLSNVTGPKLVKLRVGRKNIDVLQVIGYAKDSADFPLARSPDHKGSVRVVIWLDKDSLKPLQLELVPMIDQAGKQEAKLPMAERLKFRKHKWLKEGLLLPGRITAWHWDARKKAFAMRSAIEIHNFTINPIVNKLLFRFKPK